MKKLSQSRHPRSWTVPTMLTALMFMNLDLAPKTPEVHHEHIHAPAHIANPHLHGVRPELEHYRHWDSHVAHHWYDHWSYTYWVGLHRGLGNVEGKVIEANGAPAAGVSVSLRGSKRRIPQTRLPKARAEHQRRRDIRDVPRKSRALPGPRCKRKGQRP